MQNTQKYLIETDVILDHLSHEGKNLSYLEIMMTKGICFTTVINASELLYNLETEEQRNNAMKALTALKVIGMHSRYSLNISKFSGKVKTLRDALVCAIASENKLPIISLENSKFAGTEIVTIHPKEL
ncbi:MAG: PIN domain-containing protein [Melioribacteraceae bacterium]|nr:PIN domain-containing protein [Melioribacteraceae bacterium]MCF8354697.1 PIN domain-containing protein [Melioribacteraceae bacterium]MCF8393599.1 PIN domain-containing protein [Melioribacteraceae bacterium]MCF8419409.1 PIN domain-containing protein [Melioribacteraceae bacterium]